MSWAQLHFTPVQTLKSHPVPSIRIERASPDHDISPDHLGASTCDIAKPRGLRSDQYQLPGNNGKAERRATQKREKPRRLPSHMVKEANKARQKKEESKESGKGRMPSRRMRQSSPSVSSQEASSPESSLAPATTAPAMPEVPEPPRSKRPKASAQDIDWSEVTDPEERRRIQNRIAQRKFREKTRENKEKAERDARNHEHAGNSYRIPSVDDFAGETELSGLPWGGLSFGHAVSRGLEAESRRSSGRGTYVGDEGYHATSRDFTGNMPHGFTQAPSYGSSGADDSYVTDGTYGYSPVLGLNGLPLQM